MGHSGGKAPRCPVQSNRDPRRRDRGPRPAQGRRRDIASRRAHRRRRAAWPWALKAGVWGDHVDDGGDHLQDLVQPRLGDVGGVQPEGDASGDGGRRSAPTDDETTKTSCPPSIHCLPAPRTIFIPFRVPDPRVAQSRLVGRSRVAHWRQSGTAQPPVTVPRGRRSRSPVRSSDLVVRRRLGRGSARRISWHSSLRGARTERSVRPLKGRAADRVGALSRLPAKLRPESNDLTFGRSCATACHLGQVS